MSPTSSPTPTPEPARGAVAGLQEIAPQLSMFSFEQQSLTSDDYYTPKWIFDVLGLEFDLDVASPPAGPPFTPCRRYYTQKDDGLVQPWEGRVFMNPPFSKPEPWVRKFTAHRNGIAILAVSKARWMDLLWETDAKITLLPSNLKYETATGEAKGIFMPSLIMALGDENIAALAKLGKLR